MSQLIEFVKAERMDALSKHKFVPVNDRGVASKPLQSALKKAKLGETPIEEVESDPAIPKPDFQIGMNAFSMRIQTTFFFS